MKYLLHTLREKITDIHYEVVMWIIKKLYPLK